MAAQEQDRLTGLRRQAGDLARLSHAATAGIETRSKVGPARRAGPALIHHAMPCRNGTREERAQGTGSHPHGCDCRGISCWSHPSTQNRKQRPSSKAPTCMQARATPPSFAKVQGRSAGVQQQQRFWMQPRPGHQCNIGISLCLCFSSMASHRSSLQPAEAGRRAEGGGHEAASWTFCEALSRKADDALRLQSVGCRSQVSRQRIKVKACRQTAARVSPGYGWWGSWMMVGGGKRLPGARGLARGS